MKSDLNSFRKLVRSALADYMASEGCSCCRDEESHTKAKAVLAKLLRVPRYDNGSGYNFWKFKQKGVK